MMRQRCGDEDKGHKVAGTVYGDILETRSLEELL